VSRWLVTRPAEDAGPVAAALAERGHEAVLAPLLEIVPEAGPAPDLGGVQAILLTSANGARMLARRTARRDLPVLAVGDATARAARQAGFAGVESAGGDVADLAALARARLDPVAGPLLHAAGSKMAGDLAGAMETAGFAVRRSVLYRAEPAEALPEPAVRALAGGGLSGVLFFSPRTAAVFARLVRRAGLIDGLARLYALCLSAAVARQIDEPAWAGVRIAERPETSALLALTDAVSAGGTAP
jgi:uroporphyrinogen-III synthase